MRIHMIDDDEEMHELMQDYFEGSAFEFSASPTPEGGIDAVIRDTPDLVLLDLMMPGMDGFEVCKRLRAHDRWLPMIMLTARRDDLDKIIGLELGADDYMAKPFNPRELEARIKTILRRTEQREQASEDSGPTVLRHASSGLRLDPGSRQVSLGEELIELTTTEFDILQALMNSAGRVMTRDALMNTVHGYDFEAFDRTIDVMVYRLRQKLGESSNLIKTIRGVGYLFAKD
jgi:DNA-binding response OmpR family regulator